MNPLPDGGINASSSCEVCGETREPWVCLSCYHVSHSRGREAENEASDPPASSFSHSGLSLPPRCGQVYCGRYINEHMVQHCEDPSGHRVVLSLADLSVWCFACDSYVDNPVRPVEW